MRKKISNIIKSSIDLKLAVLADESIINIIEQVVDQCVQTFRNGGKVLFCGNGGSAADAQHIAAEFSGKFLLDRAPLFAEALHVNTSFLTAVGNDYGFDEVYARAVSSKGNKGDIIVGISTSGNSENVIRALSTGRDMGLITIAMTGMTGGKCESVSDYILKVPSDFTPRIQEVHILIGHIICQLVEEVIFKLK